MKCPVCEEELCWDSDADFDDLGIDGRGIISFYHCCNCKAEIEIYKREDDENELPELQRENDRPGI